jgi:hypothetical protein
VAGGDASVLVSQQADAGYAVTGPLGRGTTLYWKVDVTTADGKFHPGFVYSFRVADQNTENWAIAVDSVGPAYLDTYVQSGPYDIGELSGDITYEFIVNSNPDETEVSMALIGRIGHGDTTAALKYEQYNNTGNYGATIFGDVDLDYGVPIARGEYTHLAFVSSEAAGATDLYVNGVLEGSVGRAITLAGIVGIGQAIRDPEGAAFIDPFDGDIFGVAIYDRALTAEEIAANADKYFNPIPITDPDLVAYYDFESDGGSIVLDQSGHSNHGTLEDGPTSVSGKSGQALAFDNSRVAIPASGSLTADLFQGSFTLSGWINPTRTGNTWQQVFRSIAATYTNDTLFLNNDGRLSWRGTVNGGWAGGMCETAPDVVPAGQWTHFAVTGDGTNFGIYVNGALSQESAFQTTDGSNEIYYIGGNPGTAGESYAGMVDELRVYNRALTDAEIQRMVLPDVTAPGDTIQGVPNDGDWPGNEPPANAIDDVVRSGGASSKYLHRKGASTATGFQVEPSMGLTVVTGLTFTTANDDYGRDPTSFELSGSNDSIDGPYELIVAGDLVDFAQEALWPRYTMNATAITFENTTAYKYYQVLFPSVSRPNNDGLMQIAEVELLGEAAFENLAANGGLEDDLTGAGWSTYGDASMEVVHELVDAAVPEGPAEGEHCLHVTVGSAGANFWDAGLQHGGKVFEAGKSYTLSVWFKSKSGPFNINIKPERGADPWEGYGSQEVTITEEWAEYTVNTGVIPDIVDPASLTFHIAYAPGEFWADNLVFYED